MKTVVIIGRMGPLATVDLFGKIVNLTDAKCDNDHIHILIDNNTYIPFINMIEETASYINNKKAQKVLTDLRHEDVEYVILGCTELPVAFELLNLSRNYIDPTEVLAKAAVKKALYEEIYIAIWIIMQRVLTRIFMKK